jgi:hypothetical protein
MPSPKPIPKFKQTFMPPSPAAVRRATVRDVQALALEESEASIRSLAAIRDDPTAPHMARVAADKELLDRGVGKPPQTVTNRIIRSADDLTDEELDAFLASGAAEHGLTVEELDAALAHIHAEQEGTRH